MKSGIAFIISNAEDRKHRKVFEDLCNKSISCAHKYLKYPIALLIIGENKRVKADHVIDASSYLAPYIKMNKGSEIHGLIAAELLKTHIHEWSPFQQTLYLDCDAFVMSSAVKDYLEVLLLGYELSVATCASMAWKDSIADTSVKRSMFGNIPLCFPYWNFGIFGSNKNSKRILEKIREEFLTYCFKGWSHFGSCPHAQPALVRAAHALSPDHRIFTMPTRYNAHFAGAGGYAFSGAPVVLHMWKDIREMMLRE
ncbi:MAG: hypothetical protein ACXAC5_11665 [Promethearchaeota archaeon]